MEEVVEAIESLLKDDVSQPATGRLMSPAPANGSGYGDGDGDGDG